MDKTRVLKCKCGDCSHWEVIHRGDECVLKCVTCKVEYKAAVTVDPHEHLHYVKHEA